MKGPFNFAAKVEGIDSIKKFYTKFSGIIGGGDHPMPINDVGDFSPDGNYAVQREYLLDSGTKVTLRLDRSLDDTTMRVRSFSPSRVVLDFLDRRLSEFYGPNQEQLLYGIREAVANETIPPFVADTSS